MVGAGVFTAEQTVRDMPAVIPSGVHHIPSEVVAFEPERNRVVLAGAGFVKYQHLVVCPGLKLDWDAVPGLVDALGSNGVTSNYRFDLAPYTWSLVQNLKSGRALFTQPPMPIKCAGAPQKAMYLSADFWMKRALLPNIEIEFMNAGGVLFGVPDYVPTLMEYVERYAIGLRFGHTLVSVDGPARLATFSTQDAEGNRVLVTREFDMLHAVPPQTAPDFIRSSELSDAAGWVDVDPATLQHRRYPNIFALGDVAGTSNAKTAAAVRKQAPIVAHNLLVARGERDIQAHYDGYGSCPLTVERGQIVLAEFLYAGKVAPTFPQWVLDGKRPSRLAWHLKAQVLPFIYWHGMLKGREWLAQPSLKK